MDEDDRPADKAPPRAPGPATLPEIPGLGSIPPIGALPIPLGLPPGDVIAEGLGIKSLTAQFPGIGLPFLPIPPQAAPQGIFGHAIGKLGAPLGGALAIHPDSQTGPGIQIGSVAGQIGSFLPFSAAPIPGGVPGAAPAAPDKDDPPPS
ncbi:hypothetical protein OMP43_06825 [Sphingomonas sp. CBMAI 2297]|uniref:hypothetical protein n=1 Tax=Sphingomonas sp. CBMAI 2297 TaxID=2991720 RepID=UPI002456FB3C|nr:hypothetical protein [Sphingomonas sp. CBMAI 2297]MDH4743727.1 hypothetical protein [Sphingomonas sp. CBMAI 2297]